MVNLKKIFMELGNKLVERGYNPGWSSEASFDGKKSTRPIIEITEFLNHSPEAQEILVDMGIEWPVVNRSCTKKDMQTLEKQRQTIIENVFSHYNFSPNVVKDISGWQHNSPDQYYRTVFFENGDRPSGFAIFSVTFKQQSTEVADAGI